MNLWLEYVAPDLSRVEFTLEDADGRRPVTVLVGSGRTWRQAVRFPHIAGEGGLTTGSEEGDEEVRRCAVEELVRVQACMTAAASARRWSA